MLKFFFLAVLCPSTMASHLTGQALVDYVNSAQSKFITKHSEVTEEAMLSRVMDAKYASANFTDMEIHIIEKILDTIPATFDARTHWPQCTSLKLIRDQATCGSCWAFATAEIISDRICIQSHGAQQPIISPEDILSCCGLQCGDGCRGGFPIQALRWWNSKGVVTGGDFHGAGCKPYPLAPCQTRSCPESATPACSLTCQAGYPVPYLQDKHFGASAYAVARNKAAIQSEILAHGPVTAVFTLYEDFYRYHTGVYNHIAGKVLGAHVAKIIGWGSDKGWPYWLAANSWGTSWGEAGFFRIHRGVDECGIESSVAAGLK